ncbi:hypothetical protein JOC85_001204 [Bacillus mesophilus]|uniref:DUF2325 domain-containing protein n=1 Tax=Bacillus mesophilus TaxID=1808955 RepID=A0A6M0Q6N9_9BACI|nr:DUF2325 domain-containing protein [Bacillus mesophilus]MBM7660432.1 hypothetical protein [Bacillus mesophilus]NEY72016.1 DUF2325 domain-containing protein [Bacillus mesophilus]
MRSLMVVGADHLGLITEKLINTGFGEIHHIDGRKVNSVKKGIPENIDIVFVLTDYVNHNLAKVIKQKAKEKEKPIYFVKRSWSSMYAVIQEIKVGS